MRNLFIVAVLVFLVSTCPLHHQNHVSVSIKKQLDFFAQAQEIITISPGKVAFMQFPYFGPYDDEILLCNEKEITFKIANTLQAFAYIAQSYFDTTDRILCTLKLKFEEEKNLLIPVAQLQVIPTAYPQETLSVDNKRVELSDEDKKRVQAERDIIDSLLQKGSTDLLIKGPFSAPLSSKLTSYYGTKRIFNNHHQTQHLGNDFRAPIGTEIKAANSGVIIFAGDIFYGGTTIIIDHGLGIFTSYSHLSKILVAERESIEQHQIIGLSGMTGRVNGPHLHWGTYIQGHWIDGFSLIEASKKQTWHMK